MRSKEPINKNRIKALTDDVAKLLENESVQIKEKILITVKKGCFENGEYNKDKLLEYFKATTKAYPDEKNPLIQIWKSQALALEDKVNCLVGFLAAQQIPSNSFIEYMGKFTSIFQTDEQLDLFLKDPQNYITTNKQLTHYQQQILQFIINDPRFNALPSINRPASLGTFIYTPLTQVLYQLNLTEYGSTDAARFENCINPVFRDKVLENAKKYYHGPQIIGMGMGAHIVYNRENIAKTAATVRQMKRGACHNFAQLAVDDLLTSVEQDKLTPPPNIKMVSHKASLGSHTFLLLDHQSDDLTDLSNCLIIDPWAVAMGYNDTYGVFTKENYPYLAMTSNLECCYDSQKQEQSLEKIVQKIPLKKTTHGSASLRDGFFHSDKQQIAISLLEQLSTFAVDLLQNNTKKECINEISNKLNSSDIVPSLAIKYATMVLCAQSIEKTNDSSFHWKGIKKLDENINEKILAVFNNPQIVNLWNQYLHHHNVITKDQTIVKIDATNFNKILGCLNQREEHEFSYSEVIKPGM
jgi:hypothetical protein